MAVHAETTFWYVLPSLPMFLVIPALLRHGLGFYLALLLGCRSATYALPPRPAAESLRAAPPPRKVAPAAARAT